MRTFWISLAAAVLTGLAVDGYHRRMPWKTDPITPASAIEFLDAPLSEAVSMQVASIGGVPVVYRMERSGRITMWIAAGAPQVLPEP